MIIAEATTLVLEWVAADNSPCPRRADYQTLAARISI